MADDVIDKCNEFIALNPQDPTGYLVRGTQHLNRADRTSRTVLYTSERFAHRNLDDFDIRHVIDKPYFESQHEIIDKIKEHLKDSLQGNRSLMEEIEAALGQGFFQSDHGNQGTAVSCGAGEVTVDDRVLETAVFGILEMEVDHDHGRAMTDFNSVIDLDPSCALAYVYRARACHLLTGELDRPLDDLFKAIDESRNMADAYWLRYVQLTLYPDADDERNAYFEEEIKKDSYTGLWFHPSWLWEAYWLRGVISAQLSFARNDYSVMPIREVVADFDRAIDLNPDEGKVYLDRAKAWLLLGEPDRAKEDLSSAYFQGSHDWDHAEWYFHDGVAFFLKGVIGTAITSFNMAIHHNPKHASAHRAKGDAYVEYGDIDTAIEAYNAALAVYPDPLTLAARGDCYKELGKHDLALADYGIAIARAPENPRLLWGRGWVHFSMGDFKQYVDDIEKADDLLARSTETEGLVMRRRERVRSVRRSLLNFSVRPYVVEVLARRADLLLGAPLFRGLDGSPWESQGLFTTWETSTIGPVRIGHRKQGG